MDEQWDDAQFAARWDETVLAGDPTRADQLDILLAILAAATRCGDPARRPGAATRRGDPVLGLGIGSGRLEADLLTRAPDVRVVGVDDSAAMLALARRRLEPFAGRVTLLQRDLGDLGGFDPGPVAAAVAVQALHHLTPAAQRAVMGFAVGHLPPGGLMLILDRVAVDTAALAPAYAPMWERLEAQVTAKSGRSAADFPARLGGMDDHAAQPLRVVVWIESAGFRAACVHLHLNRALFAGVAPDRGLVRSGS